MDLVQQIIEDMEKLGWDDTKLAAASMLPQPTVWRTLKRKTEPRLSTLRKMQEALKTGATQNLGLPSSSSATSVGLLDPDLSSVIAGELRHLTLYQQVDVINYIRQLRQQPKDTKASGTK